MTRHRMTKTLRRAYVVLSLVLIISLATKLDRRSFRYTVLPVNDPSYALVAGLLPHLPTRVGAGRPMREKRVSPEDLLGAWPTVPDNLLPINLAIPEM